MKIVEVETYTYDELSKEAQHKAIDDNRYMETEHDWYWSCYDNFEERLKDIGIEVTKETAYAGAFYFSLDRDYFFAIRDGHVTDVNKFWEFCGYNVNDKEDNEYTEAMQNGLNLKVENRGSARMRNYIELGWGEHEDMTERLNSLLDSFLEELKSEYEYLTSDEVIQDVLVTNEFTFLANGSMYTA